MKKLLGLAACAVSAAAHAGPPIAGDVEAGRAAFAACASCHQLGPSARSAFGPQLNGILGRRAGADPGYRYSAAMRDSQLVWSEQTLGAFIRQPDRVVPGNKMRFFGNGYDERKLADLMAYLRTVAPTRR